MTSSFHDVIPQEIYMKFICIVFVCIINFLVSGSVYAETPGELPCHLFIVDHANILSSLELEKLNNLSQTIESKTTAEVAVVTIHNLGGLSELDFSMGYWDRCKIGKKIKNNGILLLLAMDDRKARMSVGYGLEKIVTDSIAKKILDTIVIPKMKQGRYFQALYQGVTAVQKLLIHNFTTS